MSNYVWLSFVYEKTNTFKGVCIVQADNLLSALFEANELNIRPQCQGCQVYGSLIDDELLQSIPMEFFNVLLNEEQARKILTVQSIAEFEAEEEQECTKKIHTQK